MPRALVRDKIAAYLGKGLSDGLILPGGKVFKHPPKITKQSDLFALQKPGEAGGVVIYLYLPDQGETRIGIDGIHGGRKSRVYQLSLICYFIWKGSSSQDAGTGNDDFIDSLTSWIEADRNCGTAAVSLGGDGSGVIFAWGEGSAPATTQGGKDINVHSAFPRDFRGQAIQVFNVIDVAVVEQLAT